MKFDMKIESDNADNGPEMVSDVLEYVAGQVAEGFTGGVVRDGNGNAVGTWEMSAPEPEEGSDG